MLKINAVLLAGGKSRRFGNVDKALLPFAGTTLIEYIYSNLKKNFNKVIIIGSKDKYSFIDDVEIHEDIYKNKGPLAGIYTGLYFSETNYNFICGCDMPFLNSNYFNYLKGNLTKQDKAEIIVPKYNGFLEPLAALYHYSLLKRIQNEILNNNLRIKSFYNNAEKKILSESSLEKKFDLKRLFFNLNYPQDLEQLLKYLEEVDRIEK
ncbi:molybdenum cofactor guanylyltransferase [Halanaerobium congolense]|jgi:molybdopterin-guanine dinucleotide biosynthesis protein A|uniref:Probable molybdenum cofactor guanylyltransferase n=1 Tax=Halanaerobium congolense TaxID=54121 RepID=A0A1G7H8S4_9FIRM|nr:molybdenum cofactor guanylyltransferase [Halanaerobium congolense]PTX17537.1 molybdenum cofactor guanylyltransferase [Halanaerobium congolense]SDE96723.1 molybdenum cofactor guanylyltransferase [Halanaerobium congolense]SDK90563.1 molybdenum cofactor guanylyltransferase [Halanaerobium congolense]SDM81195.1 molybdenum cofactor guanylyltransferase [Halanaerobium congolense]SES76274.1 molybdenum cofactor guanylyltransferase [Halanaerobium congolense]